MGKFTVYNNLDIDKTISNDLKIIVESVLSIFPVSSIVLVGGFGRGEGGVLITGCKIQPVNDYDIVLIIPDNVELDTRPVQKQLATTLSIRMIDLIPVKRSALSTLPPIQFNYDLKYGGIVLWGDNALEIIPEFEKGKVSIASARQLLLNRLICAIEAYSEKFNFKSMHKDEVFFLVNQTSKVVSSCIEASLIFEGLYHYKYQVRKELFEKHFPDKSNLIELNSIATQFKLMPASDINFDPVDYWKQGIEQYLMILKEKLINEDKKYAQNLWIAISVNTIKASKLERAEMLLLLANRASIIQKALMMIQINLLVLSITKTLKLYCSWECARERIAQLWHELNH